VPLRFGVAFTLAQPLIGGTLVARGVNGAVYVVPAPFAPYRVEVLRHKLIDVVVVAVVCAVDVA
jgi:hypothetical protein